MNVLILVYDPSRSMFLCDLSCFSPAFASPRSVSNSQLCWPRGVWAGLAQAWRDSYVVNE
jgi:hypothetical protein